LNLCLLACVLSLGPAGPAPAIEPGQEPERVAEHVSHRPASRLESVPIVLLRRSAKKAPDGSRTDVLVAADRDTDEIARRAARILEDPSGFSQFLLRLDRRARTYTARKAGRAAALAPHVALDEPAYLFLSDRQGGFPSEGFWLERPDGSLVEMKGVPFVDTVVRERDLERSIDGLEAIYAHELGHLIMNALAGMPSRRPSTAMHFVTVRTDAWCALNEGWGEHFQPMALDHYERAGDAIDADRDPPPSDIERFWYPRFAREQIEGCLICPANLRLIWWHGRTEQRLRDFPLRANHFAHALELPLPLSGGSRSPIEVQMYRDVMPPPETGRLKNGSQMLSSEGVVATLFYRLASDERLRNAFRDAAFYAQFLPEELAGDLALDGAAALVPPAENVYMKLFEVFHRRLTWGRWPALEVVAGYAELFPEEAPIVYEIFLDVTRGVTVEKAAALRHGESGYLAGLHDRLAAGTASVDGNLGPPLWMSAGGIRLGMGIFRYFPVPSTFTFDLNAADVADLRNFSGISLPLAEAIVSARENRGCFDSVDDLKSVDGMTPELLSRMKGSAARMEERLARPMRRGPDAGFMKDYLVHLLKGTYYAAAVWQYGRAMFLAGLGYLLVWWAFSSAFRRRFEGTATGGVGSGTAGWRSWWRRAFRALAGGTAAAAVPAAISLAIYYHGVLPTPAIMAPVGVAMGLVAPFLSVSGRMRAAGVDGRFVVLRSVAACAGVAALIGYMY
jgi:hypothetical protein